MNRDALAARLLATFLVELEEQVGGMNTDLLALERDPEDGEALRSLFRTAHTLKGAARAAGVPAVETACHEVETLLARARAGTLRLGGAECALLFSAADALGDAGARLRAGASLTDSPLSALTGALRAAANAGGPLPASVPRSLAPSRGAEDTAPSPSAPSAYSATSSVPPPVPSRASTATTGGGIDAAAPPPGADASPSARAVEDADARDAAREVDAADAIHPSIDAASVDRERAPIRPPAAPLPSRDRAVPWDAPSADSGDADASIPTAATSAGPGDAARSPSPEDARTSPASGDSRASTASRSSMDAQAPSAPEDAQASRAPEDAQASRAPEDAQASRAPEDARASRAPEDAQASRAPEDARASASMSSDHARETAETSSEDASTSARDARASAAPSATGDAAAGDAAGSSGSRRAGDGQDAAAEEVARRQASAAVRDSGRREGPAASPVARAEEAASPLPAAPLRVDAAKLDALISASGHLRTLSQRLAERPAELRELRDLAARVDARWRRVAHQVERTLAASRLPRSALAAVHALREDLARLRADTARAATEAEEEVRGVARATEEIAGGARRLRMSPFAGACEALPRVVRDLAAAAGKEVRLEVEGGGLEADRAVWTALQPALLHLVRNAVDHGIEPPGVRLRAGKPRAGRIRISAAARGDRVEVAVADDGAGIDVVALRARLAQAGIPAPEGDRDVVRLLFHGGVSSRAQATEISGRGVGLDSVRAAVEGIRGSVDVRWTPGEGTVFLLECPLALTSVRAVLVRVGAQLLAVPSAHVERLARVRTEEVRRMDGRDFLLTPEGPVPLAGLARLLGPPLPDRPGTGSLPVLRLVAGGRRLAVAVEELVGEQELLVRPLRRISAPPPTLAGAALLATGRVVLILNPAAVIAAGLDAAGGQAPLLAEREREARPRRILVVDDSITTRALEQSILEAAGYAVATAADGAEGWRLLQEAGADLVVSDVEMPRMDGFALCETIRASKRFRELPVILVTALETEEHRARGLEAGADAYLAKSSFEQQRLLETIRQLVGEDA